MLETAICILVIMILFIEFGIFGTAAGRLLKLHMNTWETLILGFFLYFGIFQAAALPLILLQKPFHITMVFWIGICVVCSIYTVVRAGKELWNLLRLSLCGIWRTKGLLLAAAAAVLLLTCYFQAVQSYMGWDTSYYIGTVNTTVYSDTMYIYNGNSGIMENTLDLRYALSTFYMHSAVLCKASGVSALMIQKYVMGSVCILMYGLILFAIGKKLFGEKNKPALFFVLAGVALNYGFNTIYSTASFLLIRACEAKGFCANVVIPAMFYMALCFKKQRRRREDWILLFFIMFASVPVSMSSILLIPVMAAVILITEWFMKRDWKLFWYGVVCMIPNGIYLVVYFLYTQGVTIPIH